MRLNLDPVRDVVEDLMRDTGVITRPVDKRTATLDEESGEYVDRDNDATIYDGAIWVYYQNAGRQRHGGGEANVGTYMLSLPLDAPEIKDGDHLEITVVDPDSDPELLGKNFRIGEPIHGTYMVSRRAPLELISAARVS